MQTHPWLKCWGFSDTHPKKTQTIRVFIVHFYWNVHFVILIINTMKLIANALSLYMLNWPLITSRKQTMPVLNFISYSTATMHSLSSPLWLKPFVHDGRHCVYMNILNVLHILRKL